MQGKGNRGLFLLAGKLGKDVGKPGASDLDSKHGPGRLPDGVALARADQNPTSRAGQAEQSGFLGGALSFFHTCSTCTPCN